MEPSVKEKLRNGFDSAADEKARKGKAFLDALMKYLNEAAPRDLSKELEKDEFLRRLLNNPEYIVGKIVAPRECLPEMSVKELSWCTGEEGKDWYNEGWLSIGDWIYNVTSKPLRPRSSNKELG